MRARHACLSRRAPRFILAGALGRPRGESRVSDCVRQADASRARGRASGPRCSPCSRTLLPKHARVCPGAEDQGRRHHRLPGGSRGREATRPPRRAPSGYETMASAASLQPDLLPVGGRRCPGQPGGSSMSSSRGGVRPPRRLIQAPSRCLRVGGRSAVPFAVPPELGVPQAGAASPRSVCPSPRHLRSGARPRRPVRSSTCSREGDEAGAASEEDAVLP